MLEYTERVRSESSIGISRQTARFAKSEYPAQLIHIVNESSCLYSNAIREQVHFSGVIGYLGRTFEIKMVRSTSQHLYEIAVLMHDSSGRGSVHSKYRQKFSWPDGS